MATGHVESFAGVSELEYVVTGKEHWPWQVKINLQFFLLSQKCSLLVR